MDLLGPLLYEVFSHLTSLQLENVDYWRYPELKSEGLASWKEWIDKKALTAAGRFNLVDMSGLPAGHAASTLARMIPQLPEYQRTYSLLATDGCRVLLIDLLVFRILSHRYVRLLQNNDEYWRLRKMLDGGSYRDQSAPPLEVTGYHLWLYDLTAAGFPVRLWAHPIFILNTFLLQQYRCRYSETLFVHPGDIVIDGGACWGDTALYFAHLCGATGRVFAFEFLPENLGVMERNLTLNPELHGRIEITPKALWDRSGESMAFTSRGPGSSLINGGKDSGAVSTITIDDFVETRGLDRVDFIKLDIEASEMSALRGAEQTLRRFRPRLAISVYHKEEDLIEIPQFIAGLDLGYRLFLDHFTIHAEETILFAEPEQANSGIPSLPIQTTMEL